MANDFSILGGVLAGGLSRRMGGKDKSLMMLGERTLMAHVIQRLQLQMNEVIINANGDPDRYSELDNPVVSDKFDGFCGPLAGIHALMEYAHDQNQGFTHILSVAADTPFFPPDFADRCMAMTDDQNTIILAKSDNNRHPVFGLWPLSLRPALSEFLQLAQTRKVLAFVQQHSYQYAEFDLLENNGKQFDPFFNINHPDDLTIANSMLDKGVGF